MSLLRALQDHTGAYLLDSNDLYIYDYLYVSPTHTILIVATLREVETVTAAIHEVDTIAAAIKDTYLVHISLREVSIIKLGIEQLDYVGMGIRIYD